MSSGGQGLHTSFSVQQHCSNYTVIKVGCIYYSSWAMEILEGWQSTFRRAVLATASVGTVYTCRTSPGLLHEFSFSFRLDDDHIRPFLPRWATTVTQRAAYIFPLLFLSLSLSHTSPTNTSATINNIPRILICYYIPPLASLSSHYHTE